MYVMQKVYAFMQVGNTFLKKSIWYKWENARGKSNDFQKSSMIT